MRVPLFGLSQKGGSLAASAQTRKNLYMEIPKAPDKGEVILYGRAGLDLFDSFGDTPIRGALEIGDYNYVVHRGTLWEENNAGVKNNRGSLLTTSGRVSMATNGNIIQIVDGQYGYTYNVATDTFTQIVDSDFVPAVTNTWIDGYFITDMRGSTDRTKHNRYAWSTDGSTYDALDFAAAEASPDPIQRVYNDNRQLILFGTVTTEFHNNSGNLDQPFTRTATTEWGLAAVNSVAKIRDSLIFLGQNRMGKTQTIVLNGYAPLPVSNQDMSVIIDSYGNVSNAEGRSSMQGGHPFYYLTFPTNNVVWLFDASTELWQQVTSGLTEGQYRGLFSNNYLGNTLVYDFENGNVYKENANSYTDNGQPIVAEVTSRHIFDDDYISVSRVRVDMETGGGLPSGQGSNPQCMLTVSHDGGNTYGNEMWEPMGAIGKYANTVEFWQLGTARDFVFKFRITDPVKRVITGAWMDA